MPSEKMENLKENTISYIREGDGVDSLDEVVKTKTEQQKLVYATVTYTNTSDQEADHILYLGSLMMCHNDGSTYKVYTPGEEAGDGYDRCTWDGAARTGEMKYCSVNENYGNGGNYIPSLKTGRKHPDIHGMDRQRKRPERNVPEPQRHRRLLPVR